MTFCSDILGLCDQIKQLVDSHEKSIIGYDTQAQYLVPDIYTASTRLAAGDPGAVEKVTADLSQALNEMIANESSGFDAAADDVEAWHGQAAENFKDYLHEAKDAFELLKKAVNDLNVLYSNYQKVVEACHNDLRNVLNKGIDALNALDGQQMTVALTVASAAIGMIAGGSALELVAVAVPGAISVTQATIGCSDVYTATNDLLTALGDLDEATSTKAKQIQDTVAEIYTYLTKTNVRDVQPTPPTIITATQFLPDDFGLGDGVMPPFKEPWDKGALVGKGDPTASAIGRRLAGE